MTKRQSFLRLLQRCRRTLTRPLSRARSPLTLSLVCGAGFVLTLCGCKAYKDSAASKALGGAMQGMGEAIAASFTNSPASQSAAPAPTGPITITAGADWVPLRPELEIEPGSALDFSTMGFVEAPAGKHGRVVARPDGQFAFADAPAKARRFYGVNLCFGAQYISKEEADRLADRLVRLGYNTVRIHHYEQGLTQGQPQTTQLNPDQLDRFDYLAAALMKRGIYLTTDLFVSRSVPWREVGIDREGRIPMDTYKILVPVHAGAYANWQAFVRSLLSHTNPYTQRTYASEPGLAWLSMINEGNLGNFYKDLITFPEWKQAWNQWLAKHYPDRAALATAWGAELKADEAPAQGTVGWPENFRGSGLRARDCVAFFSDTEHAMIVKMKAFLRDELGCHALVSNANSWTYFVTDQGTRNIYDYVDDHFYVDHPEWVEAPWRLPSKCANTSPIAGGATGGRSKSFTRLLDKPFTITEYNYSGPGRFRGVGGILTGAMGALQGWGGLWRFAYSHSREAMFTPSKMGYFDLAGDPLSQAAERASLCLFLRGDLRPAPHSVAVTMTEADLARPAARIPQLAAKWHWLAWVTRIGTQVVPDPNLAAGHTALLPLGWQTPASAYGSTLPLSLDPYATDDQALWTALRGRQIVPEGNLTDPARKVYQSETGELTIDAPKDMLVLDTPRTAGGYATVGQTVRAARSGVQIAMSGSDATVWVSALDDQPIRRSRRLLVTHLTDLQNTGIRYAEPERKTLLAWGGLPHLVRAGKAEVTISLSSPRKYHVWALAPNGKRLAEVPATVKDGALCFTADVSGDAANGARMLYEVGMR